MPTEISFKSISKRYLVYEFRRLENDYISVVRWPSTSSLASPSHLPLTSEGAFRIQSIKSEGRAPRAALRRMGAGSDGQFETQGFPSHGQSVWAETGSVH